MSHTNVTNCPVKPRAIANALAIFGPNRAEVRAKTVRKKPDRVETDGLVAIPRDIFSKRDVTLTADIMFLNGHAFLTTLSRRIRLVTAENVTRRTASHLHRALNKIIALYARGGFRVKVVLMDNEFEKVRDLLSIVEVNTTAAREHVGEIEREHRTIKEVARSMHTDLPFAWLPRALIVALVYTSIFHRNI